MTPADRMVPSVEAALDSYQFACWLSLVFKRSAIIHPHVEAMSLALDLATAAAHPAVREPSWRTVVEDVAY